MFLNKRLLIKYGTLGFDFVFPLSQIIDFALQGLSEEFRLYPLMAPDDDTPVHVPMLKYAELDDSFRVVNKVDI